jgi:hypothetical protein
VSLVFEHFCEETAKNPTYPRNDLLDFFLVTLALENVPDLLQTDILLVTEADDLIKGTEEFERVG